MPPRPHDVHLAGLLLFLSGFSSWSLLTVVVGGTFGLWCCAWAYSPFAATLALAVGFTLPRVHRSTVLTNTARIVAIAQLFQLLATFDLFGSMFAFLALLALNRVPVRAWSRGENVPPTTLPPGSTGIVLDLWALPIDLLLDILVPRVELGAEVRPLGWGRHALELPPGTTEIRVGLPFLSTTYHQARCTVTLAPGEVRRVSYTTLGCVLLPSALRVDTRVHRHGSAATTPTR